MKKCPSCNQFFGDENDFCLNDGTPLLIQGSTQETVFLPKPVPSGQQFQNRTDLVGQQPRGTSQYLMFGVILLLSVVAVGFGVAYFLSSKNDAVTPSQNVNKISEDKERLDQQQAQLDAANLQLQEERKKVEADKQKLAREKQALGPLPPAAFALIVDPPTNIRLTPNGTTQCVISSRIVINITNTPSIPDKNGVWYRTTACGSSGLVHSSQVTFNY